MRTLLYSLASQLLSSPDEAMENKYYSAMNELRMSILNTPHKKWTIEAMAELVHISFLSAASLPGAVWCFLHSGCDSARLKSARFYLRTTEMSIQSIAELCGYENELHFMRQFKKFTNMTPSQYRSHYLCEQQNDG